MQKRTNKSNKQKNYKKILARDAARDKKSKAYPLEKDRTVHRYTSPQKAVEAQKKGIPENTHMTATASRGRLISGKTAKDRFGLAQEPRSRLTIHLPGDSL